MPNVKSLINFLHSHKKLSIIFAVILIIIVIFILNSGRKTVAPLYSEVKRQDLRQEVSASGILTGKESALVRFKTSGKLAYMNVKAGDTVIKGQTIASLDTQDLTIALRQAENTLRDKRAIVDKIKDDSKDRTDETYAQRQTRTTAEVAQDNAYDSVLAAQRAFQDAIIVSPINGTVIKADPIPGQVVSATDTVAHIVDFSEIIFETDVDEADIAKINNGQKAYVTLNAYGEKIFDGKVIEIVPQTKTTSNGATVVTVKIMLEDKSIQKISGLNGQVSIVQDEQKGSLAVPIDAVVENKVMVKSGSKHTIQEVKTGFTTESDVEIISGLKEGDIVITNPLEFGIRQQSKAILKFF